MTDVLEGIVDLLVADTIGTLAAETGWAITISSMPDQPDTMIGVFDGPSKSPDPRLKIDYPGVQVRVRGAINGYTGAKAKCQAIKECLLGLPSQDVNGDRWVSVSMIGDINYLGYDDKRRPQFSLNFQLIVEPDDNSHRDPV